MPGDTIEKRAGDSRLYNMDFSELLAAGDTVSAVSSVAVTAQGWVEDAAEIEPGAAAINGAGTIVQFRLAGGTAGERYAVSVTVTTDGGDTLVGDGELEVM